MTIIKRADLGRPLTWDELDDNFQQVDDLTSAASAAVSSATASATSAASSATSAASSATSAADSAANAATAIVSAVKSTITFTTGGTLESNLDRISDGTYLYYWTGTYPVVIPADSTVDGTGGLGVGFWAVDTDQVLRQEMADSSGSSLMGIPQGGTVQNALTYVTPEMFGAVGDGVTDDSDAIIAACNYARTNYINRVIGDRTYAIAKGIPCTSGYSVPGTTSEPLFGFSLELERVLIHEDFDALPANWWEATPAFYSAGNATSTTSSTEHFRLFVNEFYGAFKAHFFEVKAGGMSTSHIHCGTARAHIIGYKAIGISQSTMNRVTGYLWQTGYKAAVVGGTLNGAGGGNSEAHTFDIQWCATHRYGAITLADAARFCAIRGGTYDYNGMYSSMLLLENMSTGDTMSTESANRWVFEPFDTVSNPNDSSVSSTALSQIMYYDGSWYLHVSEPVSVNANGGNSSQWAVGDTISNGNGFTAEVSSIILPSSASSAARYWDIVMCQRLSGAARCKIDAEYVGGYVAHFDFTSEIWAPHPAQNRERAAYKGLGIASSYNHLYLYANQLSTRSTPFIDVNEDGISLNKQLNLSGNRLAGTRYGATISANTPTKVMTFVAGTNSVPRGYFVPVTSSVSSMSGLLYVTVFADSIVVTNIGTSNITFTTDGLSMYFTLISSSANIYVNAIRVN